MSLRLIDVPDVLEIQFIPSEEVRIVPEIPTVINELFPKVIPLSWFVTPDVLDIHDDASSEVKIVGLYDPEDYGLEIDMWSNTDGQEIIKIFKKIKKIKLSKDAKYLMNISLLTNAYSPDENISHSDFMELKKYWLINNGDLDILETYLLKNYDQIDNFEILKFLVDEHLSNANLKKSCDTLSKINVNFEDDYLSMFKIYCLVNE